MSEPRTLLIVDVQNDFLPGGPLGVRGGDALVAPINALMNEFALVVATQDWHPHDHASFATNHANRAPGETIDLDGLPQVLWPTHCVQATPGAAFAPGLRVERFDHVVRKGTDARVDSYSGFFDNGRRHATGLGDWLRARGVGGVHVCGIATDYCVKSTALDALADGFDVTLIERACRGVDLAPGDAGRAVDAMRAAGVRIE